MRVRFDLILSMSAIKKDTLFSRRRSIAASNSHGRFVAARTKTSSFVLVKPSICIDHPSRVPEQHQDHETTGASRDSGWHQRIHRSIYLYKELGLQTSTGFVLAASFPTLADDCIDLIQKNSSWCVVPGKLKQDPHQLLRVTCEIPIDNSVVRLFFDRSYKKPSYIGDRLH